MYTTSQAAKLVGVSKLTMQRWDKKGVYHPSHRTPTGHRRYTDEDIAKIRKNIALTQPTNRMTIGYCRVSSHDQKQDLLRQVDNVSQFCTARGYEFRIIKDTGSGINYNKKGLQELLQLIQMGQVERIVLNYKDRLVRFGYELLEQICKFHEVEIVIINHTEDRTAEQELIEDLLAITTVFSSRLYGARSHKQKRMTQVVKEGLEGVSCEKD